MQISKYIANFAAYKQTLINNTLKFGIMEIKSINIRGCEVSAIFTGRAYYFTSNFYGLLCVATEINESEDGRAFSVVTGNHHTDGTRLANSVIASAAKSIFVYKKISTLIKSLLSSMVLTGILRPIILLFSTRSDK